MKAKFHIRVFKMFNYDINLVHFNFKQINKGGID